MEHPEKKGENTPALTGLYSSSSVPEPQTFRQPLSVPSAHPSSTSETTTYLVDLKKSLSKLQSNVNAFLTEKMEEDKARESLNGSKNGADKHGRIDEKKEEDMYGEEADDIEG